VQIGSKPEFRVIDCPPDGKRGFMQRRSVFLLLGLTVTAIALRTGAADAPAPARIREAVNRSLPLLEKSLVEYPRHNSCFSCHHQGVASYTLTAARSHGYAVDAKVLSAISLHTESDLRAGLDSYRSGQGQPGGVTRAGYALFALDSTGVKRDEVTTAVSGFLLQRDKARGFWHAGSNRPPAEASDFTDTFLAVRALNNYGDTTEKESVSARIERARKWLEQTVPKDTEDKVFRLWGLKEAGADSPILVRAATEILAEQREDGGWAQLPGANSDAYATGSVLTALLLTGRVSPDDAACQRGVTFLLRNQQPDGSWHVASRSKPVQPYFESGFPHGRDQFVSMAASGWATAALVLISTNSSGQLP
jgi:hypothetical protein